MSKKLKIFLVLAIVAVFLFFYLLITSESFKREADDKINNLRGKTSETQEQITASYKISVAKIISDYSRLESENITVSEIKSTKEKILSLKVPAEFRDLHLNLIMALDDMENYFSGKGDSGKTESEKIINQAKTDNGWLVE
jgi:lipopolysaccharide export LptBFGC system permease protein LptF